MIADAQMIRQRCAIQADWFSEFGTADTPSTNTNPSRCQTVLDYNSTAVASEWKGSGNKLSRRAGSEGEVGHCRQDVRLCALTRRE